MTNGSAKIYKQNWSLLGNIRKINLSRKYSFTIRISIALSIQIDPVQAGEFFELRNKTDFPNAKQRNKEVILLKWDLGIKKEKQ